MCVVSCFYRVQLFVTPRTVAHQAPLSMGFPRQAYWYGSHFLLQGIFPTQRWNPRLLHISCVAADSLPLSHGSSLDGIRWDIFKIEFHFGGSSRLNWPRTFGPTPSILPMAQLSPEMTMP